MRFKKPAGHSLGLILYLVLGPLTGILMTGAVVEHFQTLFRMNQQVVHWYTAKHLATDLPQTKKEANQREVLRQFLKDAEARNPEVEHYLLDEQGTVVLSTNPVQDGSVQTDLALINRFLALQAPNQDASLFHVNPRNPSRKEPFSAAPVVVNDKPGYLYSVLVSTQRRGLLDRTGRFSTALGLGITIFLLLLIIPLTLAVEHQRIRQRIREIAAVAERIDAGDFSARLDVERSVELGALTGRINSITDKLVSAIEQVRHADAQRRELIGNLSHDLNTPLTAAIGYLHKTLEKGPQEEGNENRRFLTVSLQNLEILRRLLVDLFDFSKIDAPDFRVQKENFSLLDMITEEIVPSFEPAGEEKGIRIYATYPKKVPSCCADERLIMRVLTNLVGNAVRYHNGDGEVRISIEVKSETLQVSIADDGPGIRQEHLGRIFDRFYRKDQSRKKDGGTGLGLAIVKTILHAHNKEIQVTSAPNEGTTFTFELDRADVC